MKIAKNENLSEFSDFFFEFTLYMNLAIFLKTAIIEIFDNGYFREKSKIIYRVNS